MEIKKIHEIVCLDQALNPKKNESSMSVFRWVSECQLSGSRDVIRQYSCYPEYGIRMRDKEGCLCSSFFFKFTSFMLSSSMLGLGDEVWDEWSPYSQGKELVARVILVLHTWLPYCSKKISALCLGSLR
jgi:hypothetical protein